MTPPLLFDLDGTLVDSRVVVERQWGALCARLGLDFPSVLAILHGVRSVDTIRAAAPHVDAEAEAEALDALEAEDTDGLEIVRGADELLACLPPGSWGIVTSGPRTLAEKRLRAVGLPVPAAMVCGDEVANGKPHPEGYLRALSVLHEQGVDAAPAQVVAFEDTEAGVASAKAAGMHCIAVAGTLPPERLAEADSIVPGIGESLIRSLLD